MTSNRVSIWYFSNQPHEELKDEDLNDLISAFSLEATDRKNRLRGSRNKFVILSPTKTRLAKIESLAGSPTAGTLRMPKRALPQPHPRIPQVEQKLFSVIYLTWASF